MTTRSMATTTGASGPRRVVAVLGEALVDLFPARAVLGGAPFNVARNLAAFGAAPLMVTRIGADALGEQIAAEFDLFGLDSAGLQRDPVRPTGTVLVHMLDRQHRFEIVADTAWDAIDGPAAVAAVQRAAPEILYFGTLCQRSAISREAIRAALAAVRQVVRATAGGTGFDAARDGAVPALQEPALRFLDLNLRDGPDNQMLSADSLALADIVKVNDEELDRLIDWFIRPGLPALVWGEPLQREAIDALMARFAVRRLVITRGADGWACRDRMEPGAGWLEGTAPPVVLRDTVGAGDAFASVLLVGELRGWPLATTLTRAASFAASVCGIEGAVDADSPIYAQARRAWSV